MKVKDDLWGEICEDYYKKWKAEFIYCNDKGIKDKGSPDSYFSDDFSCNEIKAMEYVKGHILDIGCGPGRNILWLQDRGYKVTGIDISPRVVNIASNRGVEDVSPLSMWDIPELKIKFDTVLLMGNNIGLAGNLVDTGELLKLLYDNTNEGARLIGHSIDPITEDAEYLSYQKENEKQGKYKGQIKMRREYKGKVTPWFELVFFEKDVLQDLCEDNGWRSEKIIGEGRSYYIVAIKEQKISLL